MKAQTRSDAPATLPAFSHARAIILEPSEPHAAQLATLMRTLRLGAVAIAADAAAAAAEAKLPGPGRDMLVVDLRRGGVNLPAAQATRRELPGVPMLILVDMVSTGALDLAYQLRPATPVPPPFDPVVLGRYLAQIVKTSL